MVMINAHSKLEKASKGGNEEENYPEQAQASRPQKMESY